MWRSFHQISKNHLNQFSGHFPKIQNSSRMLQSFMLNGRIHYRINTHCHRRRLKRYRRKLRFSDEDIEPNVILVRRNSKIYKKCYEQRENNQWLQTRQNFVPHDCLPSLQTWVTMKKEGVLQCELELTPGSHCKKAVSIRVTNVGAGCMR